MNLARMAEVQEEQQNLNSILGGWDVSMDKDDYYSLRDTLLSILKYTMGGEDKLPEVNPLVNKYLK
jgi:hypothetical protein